MAMEFIVSIVSILSIVPMVTVLPPRRYKVK